MDSDTVIGFIILAAIAWYLIPKPWQDRKETNRLQAELERSRTGQPGQRERSFFKNCTNCGVFALTLPFRDSLGRTYCSGECMSWLAGGGKVFCPQCLGETSVETAGDVVTHWSIGKHFGQPERPCGACGSVVREVRFVALFLPIRRLGRYRIIYLNRARFLSRRVLNSPIA